MKIKRLDLKKREFFGKAGLGFTAAFLFTKIPFSSALGRSNTSSVSEKKLNVQINPLAVKRNNKDS